MSSTPKDRANGTPNSKGKFGQLDLALQVYFQQHPEKRVHQTLFERESLGIYFFGLKKVIMKLENNQILVRVGGGYMAIDEFINQFGPDEVDKMQREDSPTRRAHQKIQRRHLNTGLPIRSCRSAVNSKTRADKQPSRSPKPRFRA